jgi:branched-chain amino acid transport system permease protein
VFAHYANNLNPSTFSFVLSVNAIIMVVLGGMGSITGSIVAATIITVLPEALRPLQEITGRDLRMVIYSVILILLMLLRPRGLFGEKELTDLAPVQRLLDLFRRKKAALASGGK